MIRRYLKQGDIRIVCWGSGLRRRRKLSIRGLMKQDSLLFHGVGFVKIREHIQLVCNTVAGMTLNQRIHQFTYVRERLNDMFQLLPGDVLELQRHDDFSDILREFVGVRF